MRNASRKVPHRDVGPFLQWLRERMLGREMLSNKRFPDELSERTQPQPNLPDGPCHRLSANYYYLRDVRRRVAPPLYIAGSEEQKKLGPGINPPEKAVTPAVGVTPGTMYDPEFDPVTRGLDLHEFYQRKK